MGALEWTQTLSGPVGVLAGIVGTKMFDRRLDRQKARLSEAEETKLDAEAARIIADTAVTLVAPLQAQITQLTTRVENLEAEDKVKTAKLDAAVRYIRELLGWIAVHIPHKQPPSAPDELGEVQ